jgi:hypothetical protein
MLLAPVVGAAITLLAVFSLSRAGAPVAHFARPLRRVGIPC